MVALVLPRLVGVRDLARRSGAVAGRNVAALRPVYWVLLVSGLLEPLLYLFSIGVGVGSLIGDLTLPGGQVVGYATFVAPAMLAASAMTGALAETTFTFFGKIKYLKLYDGMIATPVRPFEIALGELGWAMLRGSSYSVAFLVVMVAMGLTSPVRALVALPAAVLVGFAFGALGLAFATYLRSWQDLDLMGSAQFTLFLFSGTFVPAETYPTVLRWLVEVTPLYRSVHLIRDISIGAGGWTWLLDVLYLLVLTGVGLLVASRRMNAILYR
ncbi:MULTISPECIES: ABC transporter permease [Micromonospora]|uniref:Transport permease protein n=1 Tax=Micromonospora yangpuensis TaxID=683228 RepID=A0A1C6V451_9ACTN|nr:ABC transporter permease [Micromonospora yangpuensis]GGM15552.1 transport permease protein [Micromonospora yangpuensis]SCL61066.1 lipooligosaccharide transport system permease protein [Micromonospora yangpuensis]